MSAIATCFEEGYALVMLESKLLVLSFVSCCELVPCQPFLFLLGSEQHTIVVWLGCQPNLGCFTRVVMPLIFVTLCSKINKIIRIAIQ